MKTGLMAFAFAALPVLSGAFAWGGDFSLTPSASVKEEYNSNVLLSTDGAKRDSITVLSAGAEMKESTYRLDTGLLLRVDRLEYSSHHGLSATNQTYNGEARYRASERLEVSAGGGFIRNSNPTLDIGSNGAVLVAAPWNRVTSSLSAGYRYDELTTASVSYSYGRDYYANPLYADDISHDVTAGLSSDLGGYFPSLKADTNAGWSRYAFKDSTIDNVTAGAGLSWDLNETIKVAADAGLRRTWSRVSAANLKSKGWGWVGKVSLNYGGEKGNAEVSYTRDVAPAYGFNGAAESDSVTFLAQKRFTEETTSFITAGYDSLKSVSRFSARGIDKQIFRVNTGVRYEFSKDAAAEAAYEYTRVDYRQSAAGADRHVLSLRLRFQHVFFE